MSGESFEELCRRLEHWETDDWSPDVILRHEILTRRVVDPNTGTGILAEAAKRAGYDVTAADIHDWGYEGQNFTFDYLSVEAKKHLGGLIKGHTVFMNPPFSKACSFVDRSFHLGARKVLCYQRLAWWESQKRRAFWGLYRPARIYICGDRATCWRHDITPEQRQKQAGTTTAHAWFVFEPMHPPGPLLSHIWREG